MGSADNWSLRGKVALTPSGRDRVVDLLRAVAILVVVVGHWIVIVVFVQDGRLTGTNGLELFPPAAWLSWVFQVMPLFFLVGGYAGLASWQSARAHHRPPLGWLEDRLRRLLRPTTAFLLAVAAGTAVGMLVVDPGVVGTAAWLVAIPLWFLAVYVAVVAATPVLVAAQERWGLRVPVALALAVTVSDGLRIVSGHAISGALNFLLVWLCLYALGMAWRSGLLLAWTGMPAALLVGGGLLAVALIALGPYPMSMLGIPGQELQNTSPPTLALLAYGVAQAGLVLLLRTPLKRICQWPVVWTATVVVNANVLTIYLWHMVPVLVVAPALYLTGVLSGPEPLSAEWWALRPVWVGACATILLILVVVFGRAERPSGRERARGPAAHTTPIRVLGATAGVLAVCAGLALLTAAGPVKIASWGVLALSLVLYALGLALVRYAVRAHHARAGT